MTAECTLALLVTRLLKSVAVRIPVRDNPQQVSFVTQSGSGPEPGNQNEASS